MSNVISIQVSICTYKRNRLLKALLNSLEVANVTSKLDITVVVVDNDSDKGAEKVVKNINLGLPIKYLIEPERNISAVRNVGLKYAINKKLDYILFLDDDEYVATDYFIQLNDILTRSNPDIVIGPVITEYYKETPSWVIESKTFERKRNRTGTKITTGNTGNALVRLSAIANIGYFNLEYGHSGGEDAEFFYRCHKYGLNMIWCDKAKVFEYLELSRCTLSYILLRARRGGQTYSKIRVSQMTLKEKILSIISGVIIGGLGCLVGGFIVTLSRKRKGINLLKRSIAKLAQVEGYIGKTVSMYGQ